MTVNSVHELAVLACRVSRPTRSVKNIMQHCKLDHGNVIVDSHDSKFDEVINVFDDLNG